MMEKNLPRLLYFEIINSNGARIYTLRQNEIAYINIAVCIPDNLINPQNKDGDLFIQWTINSKNIEYDDIPVQEIIRTSNHILHVKFTLDTSLQDSIHLNLSLGAKYSDITPEEQIERFSFFKTVIKRNPSQTNEKEASLRFDNEDWVDSKSRNEIRKHQDTEFNKKKDKKA